MSACRKFIGFIFSLTLGSLPTLAHTPPDLCRPLESTVRVNMDFREVCDFFGGSPFYEDLHINFASVRLKLQSRIAITNFTSFDETGSIILLSGILSLLEGNIWNATTLFEHLRERAISARYDRRWVLRANIYSALACIWREFPPLLQPCELEGPALRIWKDRNDYDDGHRHLENCELEDDGMVELVKLEYEIIHTIFLSQRLLAFLRRSKGDFTGDELQNYPPGEIKHHLRIILRRLNELVRNSLDTQFPLVAAYLIKIQHDLAHSIGQPVAIHYLELIKSLCAVMGDKIGLGQYCLAFGDWIVSPCHTSPLVLNFSITDELDEYGGDSTMYFAENVEYRSNLYTNRSQTPESIRSEARQRVANRITAAVIWYDKAKQYFERADSTRGLAACTLRKACVYRMQDIQPATFWGPKPSRHTTTVDLLHKSLQLSEQCKDYPLMMIAKFHQMTGMQMSMSLRDEMHTMADWTLYCNNEIFGLGLALLGLRKGHYSRYVTGSVENAYIGYEFCRQLTKSMRVFWTLWHSVMLAQFRLTLSMGRRRHASIWAGHLKRHWPLMMEECTVGVRSDWGVDVVLWFFTAIIDAVAMLGPDDDEKTPFPDAETEEMLGYLESGTEAMQSYTRVARNRLRHVAAITWYRRHLQNGDIKTAQIVLLRYLETTATNSQSNLAAFLYKSDILFCFGDYHEAQRTLIENVNENKVLPDCTRLIAANISESKSTSQHIANIQRTESLEAIFLSYIQAGLWSQAAELMDTIELSSPGYFTSVSSYTDLWPWQRCLYAGLVLESRQSYKEAYLYFLQARYFLLGWAHQLLDEDYRLLLAKPEVARLMGGAARRALICAKSEVRQLGPTSNQRVDYVTFTMFSTKTQYDDLNMHYIEALVFLEAARPQYLWKDSTSELTSKQIEAQQKCELWTELYNKTNRNVEEEAEFQSLHPLRETYFALFDETKHLRHETAGLTTRSVASMFASVPEDAIVLYHFTTQDGTTLLALDNEKVRIAAIYDGATLAFMEKLVIMYVDSIQSNDTGAVDQLCDTLSSILITPLNNCIAKRSHVIFVLSGILTRIPVSSLKYKGEYLILQKEVSQLPSLRALDVLSKRERRTGKGGKPEMSVIARPGGPGDKSYKWLPMAGIEAMLVSSLCNTPARNAKNVDRAHFRELIQRSHFLHISTHGVQDADRPFNSHVILKETFRVLDLLAVNSDIFLVTFSACFSGVGHASDSGDVQGFSHAMLAAGANAYLGALWKVNDIATMLHMWIFYLALFGVFDKPTLAEAWQFATCELYRFDTQTAITWMERIVQAWDGWEAQGKNPHELVGSKTGRKKLQRTIDDWKAGKNLIVFQEPRIWAPFVMVGNASLRVWTTLQAISKKVHEFGNTAGGLGNMRNEEVLEFIRSLDPGSLEMR